MTNNNDEKQSGMTVEEILKILPHRYPFLLIDRVLHVDPAPPGKNWIGRKCVALKNVTFNEHFFSGHFPHKPIMPGVLIIEAIAQAAAVCGHRPHSEGMEMDVMIASITGAKFRKPVVPGDQLIINIEILKDRGSMFLFSGKASVDGQVVAEAEMLATSFPKKGQTT